jgi:ribosome-binding factor A
MTSYRVQRVSDEIKRIISEILIKEIPDDRGNLLEAKVYISIYNEDADQRRQSLRKIIKQGSLIRKLVGSRIILKRVPLLHFLEDDTIQYAEKIERLIQQIHEQDETGQAGT